MQIVGNVIVSDELIENYFCCDCEQCVGACCIEGDVGAPLEPFEIADLEENFPIFKKYMLEEGVRLVETNGTFDYDMEGEFVTPLLSNEACAYIYYENGVAKCAIERAFLNHEIDFQKPISCHLYPIRIKKLPDYDALNYHRWFVCETACELGEKMKLPIYQFLKNPLIRKYGEDWYNQLKQCVLKKSTETKR